MDLEQLQERLRSESYDEVARQVEVLDSAALIRLLDSSVRKVGNTVAEVLASRQQTERLIDAIVSGTLSTRLGRIRALNMLHRFGKACPSSRTAYLAALSDRSADVIDCALFGLAFMQDDSTIPHLEEVMAKATKKQVADRIAKAIEAIKMNNPHIYSPYFHDEQNVWQLRDGDPEPRPEGPPEQKTGQNATENGSERFV